MAAGASREDLPAAGAGWVSLATRGDIVQRSLRLAAVIGSVLVAINYADRLFAGALAGTDWIKIGLTYCVPYCVTTFASVSTLRAAGTAAPR